MTADLRRRVLLVAHGARPDVADLVAAAAQVLADHGLVLRLTSGDAADVGIVEASGIEIVDHGPQAADGCELTVVLGGDGTVLRAAELSFEAGVPLLGVNLGHVGFLAEAEQDDLATVVHAVVHARYEVEARLALDVRLLRDGVEVARTWALNEASVEKTERQRLLHVLVEVDGRPVSRWGCDGVVAATPTGSTAYAFSAGGPVVWPEVEALVLVPISAHALFARPLVVSPTGLLAIEVVDESPGGVLWCDGRRTFDLPPGARVEVRRNPRDLLFARLHDAPFTDRLVAKFALPVDGWRDRRGGPS